MKKLIYFLFLLLSLNAYCAEDPDSCTHWKSFFKPICQTINKTWTQGSNELYVSGYAWHNRFIYTEERIRRYNELAWGGGLGKGLMDERGNWHGLYAIGFLDSHSHVQPVAGYAYLKMFTLKEAIKAGIGYSVLVTSRTDINHNIPFPGAVPWAALMINKITIAATYIPGNSSNGNVLYLFGKYTF